MDLLKNLTGLLGGEGLATITKTLDQKPEKTDNTLNTALGFLFGGLEKNASTEEGAIGISKAVEKHDENLLTTITSSFSDGNFDMDDGLKILGHIFGDKTSSVEQSIAESTGVSKDKAGGLLQMLAPLVLGSMNTEKKSDGSFDISKLSEQLGGAKKSANDKSLLDMDMITRLLNKG